MSSDRRAPVPAWTPRQIHTALGVLLLFAFALRVFLALHSPNVYYPDEIFQTQEIGHRLAFGNGVVAWEWRDGIRSYVVPFLLSLLMRLTVGLGAGSAGYLTAIAITTSALSLAVVWFCFEWARRIGGNIAGLIAGSVSAIWFLVVFFSPKTFTEVLATDFLLPAMLVGFPQSKVTRKHLFASGVLLGLSVALRPQFAPVVLLLGLWICWADLRHRLPALAAGVFLPILAFGIVDAFTLSYPFASFIRYFWVNVGQGKSKQFGTEPWYFFIKKLITYCWPLLIPAFFGLRKSPVLGSVLLVLVGSHSVLAHKEFRFIYAAVPLLIALFGIGCAELIEMLRNHVPSHLLRALTPLTIVVIALLSWEMGSHFTHWHDSAETLAAEDLASRDVSVCGLGIYGLHWAWTGGYTHVHRDIPIILPETAPILNADSTQFNMLLTPKPLQIPVSGFTLEECRYGTCVYRRAGACTPAGAEEINTHLKQIGQ